MPHPIDPVLRLHHFAWRCKDAEETRAFYELEKLWFKAVVTRVDAGTQAPAQTASLQKE